MNPRQIQAFRALEIGPPLLARAVESHQTAQPSPAEAGPGAEPVHEHGDAIVQPAPSTRPAGKEIPSVEIASDAGPVADLPMIDSPAEPAPAAEAIASMGWVELTDSINTCQRCSLCETRTNAVPGNGSMPARWVVVGEAPGRQEDRSGEPFVGEAGKLLDAMLKAAGTGRDQDVFVINAVKCRPPENRDPSAQELAACRPYLLRQLELLAPALIMTVGRISAQTLLGTTDSIGSLRGRVHQVSVGEQQIPLVVSYHPAYFLRRPEEKRKGWQDLCLAMATSPLLSTDQAEPAA